MNPYKTEEGSDVAPAVLHEWERTITNHVCDVAIETVSTFRERKDIRKVNLVFEINLSAKPNVHTVVFAPLK